MAPGPYRKLVMGSLMLHAHLHGMPPGFLVGLMRMIVVRIY